MAQQQSVKSHRVKVRGSTRLGLWSCLLNVVLLRSVPLRSVLVRTVLSSALLLSAAADAKTEVAENNQSLSSSAASSQNVNLSQKDRKSTRLNSSH